MRFSSMNGLVLTPMAFLCLAMTVSPDDVPRFLESAAAKSVTELLQSPKPEQVAMILEYPRSYTSDQLAEDQKGIAGAVTYLLGEFGLIKGVKPFQEQVTFIEIGVAGGSAPFWWQTDAASQTRQYIYRVDFEKFGPGYLKVLTHLTSSKEIPVAFAFGLDPKSRDAEARIRAAMSGLMDLMGVPKEHPARTMPIPAWQAPAIAD